MKRGNLDTRHTEGEEVKTVGIHREKTAANQPRGQIQNRSFPHCPQKESTLLTL